MKNVKRFLSLFLLLCLTVSFFSGCNLLPEAPTEPQETTKPVTNAPSNTQAPTTTPSTSATNNSGKGGCGSTVAIGAIAVATLMAVPFVMKRRED